MSNAIEGILGVSMEKIREMVDVNTIIGDPISAPVSYTHLVRAVRAGAPAARRQRYQAAPVRLSLIHI